MAGDWVHIQKDTPFKPEVVAISSRLGLSPFDVFGRLFVVWSWADSNSIDGSISGVPVEFIDTLAGHTGFAQEMVRAGWLKKRASGIEFPHFDRWMGESAKKRLSSALRKRTNRDVTKICDIKRTTSSLLFSPGKTSSEEETNQKAEVRGPPVTVAVEDGPAAGQTWGAWLTVEWVFHFRGTQKSERDHETLGGFFADLIASGVRPEDVRDAIRDPKRRKREPTWEFERRWKDRALTAPGGESLG